MPEARPKSKKQNRPLAIAQAKHGVPGWMYAAAFGGALLAAFLLYAPALNGPFVFDDTYLPYHLPNFTESLKDWITGVRPLLMFTYWINYEISKDPFGFHVTNVFIHAINSLLVYFIVKKLADTDLLAAFAAVVFLLHPIQTESVAYVAGRSESLSVMFFLAAFTVFLYRRSPVASWRTAIAVLLLFGAAVLSKEHTLVLPALLLLTDYYFNPGFSLRGIRGNWRIYVPIALAGAAGVAFLVRILALAPSAGFGIKEFTWYQYFFTECRAFFVYLRLLVLPVGQDLDWDFAISRTIADHGAIIALAVILILIAAAFYFRRRDPLASYGFLVYVLLLAPTSSFVPIKDPLAERRLYLPMIGILLLMTALLRRVRIERRTLAAAFGCVAVVLAILTYQRNQVWASETALWEDTARESPHKARAQYQLAFNRFSNGRCKEAVDQYAVTASLEKPDRELLVDWGLAYECAGQPDQAVAKLREAAAMQPSAHIYSQIGMVYAKQARWPEAMQALTEAEKLDANYAMTYYYRGGVRAKTGDFSGSVTDYQRALALDPNIDAARQGLAYAQRQLALQH